MLTEFSILHFPSKTINFMLSYGYLEKVKASIYEKCIVTSMKSTAEKAMRKLKSLNIQRELEDQ